MMLALHKGIEELKETQAISREQLHTEALPKGVRHRPLGNQVYVMGEPRDDDIREEDCEGQKYVKLLFPGDTAKLIVDRPVPEGHTAAMLIYATHPSHPSLPSFIVSHFVQKPPLNAEKIHEHSQTCLNYFVNSNIRL